MHVQHVEGHEDSIEEPGVLCLEILFVAAEGQVFDLGPVETVFAGGDSRGGKHGAARGRIEAEIVPHVADHHGSLVGSPFRVHAGRRIAGAIEGEHADHVAGAGLHLGPRKQDGLESGGAGLLHMEAGQASPKATGDQRRVPELPVPRHGGTDDQVLQFARGDPSDAEDPVHGFARELADVDLRQGGHLPRGEVTASPGPVGDSGIGKHHEVFCHRSLPEACCRWR